MSFKPDVISQICMHCDYPLWRAMITKYRHLFGKVILYPSNHHGHIDMESFWEENFPETWVKPVEIDYGVEDWRQAETIPCLSYSDSDWIWFTEADFFTKDWEKFFDDMEKFSAISDMMGLWNPTHSPYIHPSCLFIKRELLEKTSKDFRAHPEINGADHFSMITQEAKELGKIITLQDMGYKCEVTPDDDCFHLGGLTYVYQDFKGDDTIIGVKSPEAFFAYNAIIRPENFARPGVPLSPEFSDLSRKVEAVLTKKGIGYNPNWEKFFQL